MPGHLDLHFNMTKLEVSVILFSYGLPIISESSPRPFGQNSSVKSSELARTVTWPRRPVSNRFQPLIYTLSPYGAHVPNSRDLRVRGTLI